MFFIAAAAWATSRTSAPPLAYTVRLAERRDLLPLSKLVEEAFASNCWSVDDGSLVERERGVFELLEAQATALRIALDIERRMTPWDWARHAQLVAAADDGGELLGFVEIWGEDKESLGNASAQTPQPVLFNLCVAASARRRGVAQQLIQRCEEFCTEWGDMEVFLKVREDNEAAFELYSSGGWQLLETRAPTALPSWQDRWKGGTRPLRLLRKPLPAPAAQGPTVKVRARTAREFELTLDDVLAYESRDALVWFILLVVRNAGSLTPQYRALPAAAVLGGWLTYFLIIKALSTST